MLDMGLEGNGLSRVGKGRFKVAGRISPEASDPSSRRCWRWFVRCPFPLSLFLSLFFLSSSFILLSRSLSPLQLKQTAYAHNPTL